MTKQNKGRKLFATTATAALVASAIVPVASAASFTDAGSIPTWATDAVNRLADSGVLEGDTKGNFNPNGVVTRAQAATIFYKALGLQATGGENFADVDSDDWWYDAVVATSPELFQGDGTGKFLPKAQLTRAEAAKVIVAAYGLTGEADLSTFSDASSVKAWAKESFSAAVANGVINGKGTKLAPNDSITRAEFATMVARAIDADPIVEGVQSVKAINATTVEVDFKDAIEDIETLDFLIDGLDVKNAAVKQTDNTVAVLTTATQEAGKEYTVTNKGETLGKFKGVSAVVPSKVELTTSAVQGKIGQQVTLSAKVTVKEGESAAGIPVTFNVDSFNSDDNLNKDFQAEAYTNEHGIATYSYTQYNAGSDAIAVYPTGTPTVRSTGTVYWGVDTILQVVVDDKEGSALENTAVKQYKVIYKDPETGEPVSNAVIDLTFQENVGVNVDKLNNATINGEEVYQLLNGDTKTVQVRTNKDGEAVFYVSGENTSATPVAFLDTDKENNKLDARELSVVAEKVTFAATDYKFTITSKTKEEAATGASNGREFEIVVTDKDGKAVQGRTVNVGLNENLDNLLSTNTEAQVKAKDVAADKQIKVELDKNGKAKFTVFSDKINDYATPVVWIDVDNAGKLDEGEPKIVGEKTYFVKEAVVQNGGSLEVVNADGDEKETFAANAPAFFEFSALNQSGKAVAGQAIKVSYTVKNTGASDLEVFDGTTLKATVAPGETKRVEVTGTSTTALKVQPEAADVNKNGSVQVTAVGETVVSGNVASINLGSKTATAKFTSITEVADTYTGNIVSIDTSDKEVTFAGKEAVSYEGASFKNQYGNVIDEDTFEALVLGGVSATYLKSADDKVSFNIITSGTGAVPDLSTPVTDSVTFAELNLNTVDTAVSANTAVATAKVTSTGVEVTAKSAGNTTVTVTEAGAAGTADDKVTTIAVTVTKNATTGALSITATPKAYAAPDTTAPTASGFVLAENGTAVETITITVSEALNLADGAAVTGFTTSTGSIATATYDADTKTIVLTSGADAEFTATTTVSYSQATGNVVDAAGNELAAITNQAVTVPTP